MEAKVKQALALPCVRCGAAMKFEAGTDDAMCWTCSHRVSSSNNERYYGSSLEATSGDPKRPNRYLRVTDRNPRPNESLILIWMVHGQEPFPETCIEVDCDLPTFTQARSGLCATCREKFMYRNKTSPPLWATVAARFIAPVVLLGEFKAQQKQGRFFATHVCLWPEQYPVDNSRYRHVRESFKLKHRVPLRDMGEVIVLKPVDDIIPIYDYYRREFDK